MSVVYKFYFDGTEVENPDGWAEFTTTIKRDDLFNSLLVTNDGQLTFSGSGYQYLWNKLNESFCNSVIISIKSGVEGSTFTEIISGTIFIAACKFYERSNRVDVNIEDKSFYTSINNNKSIKTSVFSDSSKNGLPIATAPTYNLDIYTIASNTLLRNNAQAVRVYDAFRFIVDFMTDGSVGFESDVFDVGGEWEGLCITSGYQLRTASSATFPQFSFQQLYEAIKSRIPIGFKILNPYTSPVLKVELLSDLYGSDIAEEFSDIDDILTSVDQTKLYAKIVFSTGATDDDLTLEFPEDIDFFGFKEEEFFITGNCNLDTALELNCDWICSSNVIESTVEGSQSYDTNLFLIDSTLVDATNGRTTNTDFLAVNKYYYNERLTNYETAVRYIGFVPNSIASYLSASGSGTFHAYLPSDITHTATVAPDNDDYNPLALSAEIFDISSAYNTTTYRFTAPDAGVYKFNTNIHLNANGSGVGSATAYFQAYLRVFNSSGVLQDVGESFSGIIYGIRVFTPTTFLTGVPYVGIGVGGSYDFTGNVSVVLRQGDYVILRFSKVGTTGDIDYEITAGQDNTYFKCEENTLGGGIFQTGDPSVYPVMIHEFQYPMSRTQFENLVESNTSFVSFNMDTCQTRKAWIKEIVYNESKGNAQIKLITDKTSNAT